MVQVLVSVEMGRPDRQAAGLPEAVHLAVTAATAALELPSGADLAAWFALWLLVLLPATFLSSAEPPPAVLLADEACLVRAVLVVAINAAAAAEVEALPATTAAFRLLCAMLPLLLPGDTRWLGCWPVLVLGLLLLCKPDAALLGCCAVAAAPLVPPRLLVVVLLLLVL